MNGTHLTWEVLNDYADGVLASEVFNEASRHLDACATCTAQLADLRTLLGDARSVPRAIDPPDEVWPAVRSTLERQKVVGLPGSSRRAEWWRAIPATARWTLVAAALALVAGSSGLTAVVLRGRESPGMTPTVAIESRTAERSIVAVAQVERGYLDSVVELNQALEAARPHLAPRTIAIVERNLGVIDAAIAESRAALLRDPGNRELLEVLAGSYRQKLDLLRRATQLVAS